VEAHGKEATKQRIAAYEATTMGMGGFEKAEAKALFKRWSTKIHDGYVDVDAAIATVRGDFKQRTQLDEGRRAAWMQLKEMFGGSKTLPPRS
jgi:hypothetical protein